MSSVKSGVLVDRGEALEPNRPKKAAKAYELAVLNDPSNDAAWNSLARALARLANPALVAGVRTRFARHGLDDARIEALVREAEARPAVSEPEQVAAALRANPADVELRAGIRGVVSRHYQQRLPADVEEQLVRLPLPTHIRIETASVCNLRCAHCTTGVAYKSTDRRVMSMATFERVLSELRTLPSIRTAIMYLGGEPLLNKHHATMCRRVKEETQIRTVKFVTNAVLLTQKWCDEIAAADVDGIHISVDGRSPEENDRIRVGASYETVRDNVRMLERTLREKGSRTRIMIGNTVFRRPGDNAKPEIPDFIATDFAGMKIQSGYAMVWPGMTAADTTLEELRIYQDKPPNFCDHPFYDLGIRANGDVVLCCYDISGREVMGNVMTDDLLALYQSEPYVAIRRAMLRRDGSAVPDVCKRCVNFTGDRFLQNPMRE